MLEWDGVDCYGHSRQKVDVTVSGRNTYNLDYHWSAFLEPINEPLVANGRCTVKRVPAILFSVSRRLLLVVTS